MKAIVEGIDPGNIGVKDTSKMDLPSNMNIKELCDPTSQPIASTKKSVITPNKNTNTSNPPHSYTSSSPQSYSSTQSYSSCSLSSSLSSFSPSMVSPEVSSIPPNVVSQITYSSSNYCQSHVSLI